MNNNNKTKQKIQELKDKYEQHLIETRTKYDSIKYKQSRDSYYLFALIQAYDGIVIHLGELLRKND